MPRRTRAASVHRETLARVLPFSSRPGRSPSRALEIARRERGGKTRLLACPRGVGAAVHPRARASYAAPRARGEVRTCPKSAKSGYTDERFRTISHFSRLVAIENEHIF